MIYIDSYWKYYRSLENRFLKTEDYVAFDAVNDSAYSIEYLTLLQTVCSEIDVVGKAIVLHFNPSFKAKDANIQKWGYEVQQEFPEILTQKVVFRNGEEIIPWDKWMIEQRVSTDRKNYLAYSAGCGSPDWWNAYNKVKHARTSLDDGRVNYTRANQKNVIHAFAALYVLHRLMIRDLGYHYGLIGRSELFRIPGRMDEEDVKFVRDEDGDLCQVDD